MNVHLKKIAAVAVALFCCMGAYAYDFMVGGVYYNKKSATEVEVTYKDIYDNTKAYAGSLVVPEKVTHGGTTYRVTAIGQMACYMCANLTSVTLPEGVVVIDQLAFGSCPKLVKVNLPNSVREIGICAFYHSALTGRVTIPEGVTKLPNGAFEGCGKITSVEFPNTLKVIGETVFKGCTSLQSVQIPASVQEIMYEAFRGCTSLTSVSIPKSVAHVDSEAFIQCPNLKVMEGGSAAYTYDFLVNGVYYKKFSPSEVEVTYLDENQNGNAYSGNVVIPKTVKYDGVAYNVVAIGDNAFNQCWKLESVTIPTSVKKIGEAAFSGCIALATPIIPASVQWIGPSAFNGCKSFTGIITLPEGIEKIEGDMFVYCDKLTSIKLPTTITGIDSNAFRYCSMLKNIVIPNGVKYIGAYAFESCSSLKTINIPDGLTTIDDQAFAKTGLTTITIPVSVTQIHPRSFDDCKFLGENHANVILLDKSHKGQINGYEWVDLGLPSGLKWASCNVGASKPNQYGGYYSWGEVKTKSYYKEVMPDAYAKRNTDISGNPEKDAATANWGAPWRMPTLDDVKELKKHTMERVTTMNGVAGIKLVSRKNFHYIFIPFAGCRLGNGSEKVKSSCFFWTSTPAKRHTHHANFFASGFWQNQIPEKANYYGFSIRPVTE